MLPSITARLALVQTPLGVLWTRLPHESVVAPCVVEGKELSVTFPAPWPGDVIVLFPMRIDDMTAQPGTDTKIRTIIACGTSTAVGCKGDPDPYTLGSATRSTSRVGIADTPRNP